MECVVSSATKTFSSKYIKLKIAIIKAVRTVLTHERKIKLIVADNAKDIQGALRIFGAPRIGCAAHTINLVAKNAMKDCKRIECLTEKLAQIVRTTKVSAKAKRALIECCKIVGIEGNFFPKKISRPLS